MNVLLVNVPSRRGAGGFTLPLGLLSVGAIVESCGHNAKVFDPYLRDFELKDFDEGRFDHLDELVKAYRPSVVGFGGISTSYGRTKKLSLHLKDKYPEIVQIAGAPLASVDRLLLTKARVDVVFHGETEVSLPMFLEKLVHGAPTEGIPGTSHLRDGEVVRNAPPEQVRDLDTLPLPAYHLIDVSKYLRTVESLFGHYKASANPFYRELAERIRGRTHYFQMVTSRGCIYRCSFCYRHVRGFRQQSVAYVIAHMKYLKNTYGIEGFELDDELFNGKPQWVMEFCDAIEREHLDIFYVVSDARVDRVDEAMLRRLKETGCVMVSYGQESGSDAILKEYRKGTTAQKNLETTLMTKRIGLLTCVQLVIGSPGETTKTIRETIQFLKDVDDEDYSLNYLVPFPETPIWKYVEEHNLVADLEKYLDMIAERGGRPIINLTKESDGVWRKWAMMMRAEMILHRLKKSGSKRYYVFSLLYRAFFPILPDWVILRLIPRWIRRLVSADKAT